MTVATELTRLCAEKGVTGYELAKRLDLNHVGVYRWLSGERTPTLGHVAEIAVLLKLRDTDVARIVRAAQRPQEET